MAFTSSHSLLIDIMYACMTSYRIITASSKLLYCTL